MGALNKSLRAQRNIRPLSAKVGFYFSNIFLRNAKKTSLSLLFYGVVRKKSLVQWTPLKMERKEILASPL